MEIHHIASRKNKPLVLYVQLTTQAAQTNENKTKHRGNSKALLG